MKSTLIVLVLAFVSLTAATAIGLTPGLSFREGYVVLLKDGGTPGPVGTRIDFTVSEKISETVSLIGGVGVGTPNDVFKPSLRIAVGGAMALVGRWSVHASGLFQRNIGYGGKPSTTALAVGGGPTYKVADGVALSLSFGPGKMLDGDWSFLIQPSISISFL